VTQKNTIGRIRGPPLACPLISIILLVSTAKHLCNSVTRFICCLGNAMVRQGRLATSISIPCVRGKASNIKALVMRHEKEQQVLIVQWILSSYCERSHTYRAPR